MNYHYSTSKYLGTGDKTPVSLNDCEIIIDGNVLNKDMIKEKLGKKLIFKSSDKPNPFKGNFIELLITIIPPTPMYINEINFDGGKATRFYNSTMIKEIKGLSGYFWKNMNNYNKYSKVRILITNVEKKSVDSIIESLSITFKD